MTKDHYLIAFFPLVMTLVGMSFVYGLYTDQDQLVVIAFTAVCLSLFFLICSAISQKLKDK